MAKQTLNQKADGFIESMMINGGLSSADILKKHLINLLKEQDRDTRHACAELVAGMVGVNLDLSGLNRNAPAMIQREVAHDAIMNCRGGIE